MKIGSQYYGGCVWYAVICHIQAVESEKLGVYCSLSLRPKDQRDASIKSWSPMAPEPGALMFKGRRTWMSQLKNREWEFFHCLPFCPIQAIGGLNEGGSSLLSLPSPT